MKTSICILLDGGAASWREISQMGIRGIAFVLLIIILSSCWMHHFSKPHSNGHGKLWNWIENHLSILFALVWVYCFLVYFIGSYVGGTDFVSSLCAAISVVPMSIIYATEAFVGASDISAVFNDRHDSWIYMALFDTSHLLAVTVSLCFVIKHLGYYAVSKYRFWRERLSHRSERYSDIFVFWGVNKATYSLAESTVNSLRDNNYLIVFVKTPLEDSEDNQPMGFDRILNFVSMKEREMGKLESLGNTVIVNSYHRLSGLQLEPDGKDKDVLSEGLKMGSLAKILGRANGKIHIFFFDEDQNANINATANIIRDASLKPKTLKVYCLARINSKTGWMEHYGLLHKEEKTDIHVIDSAVLSVYQLKKSIECHPVNYVKWDARNVVPLTKFSSLIIGFHETGLEALKYLYEFSSFADEKGNRVPEEYVAIDSNMDSYEGEFYTKRPALVGNKEISLVQCEIGDDKYWATVKGMLSRLNYVVIAAGDDDRNLNAAVDICRMAYYDIERDPSLKLTVFIKSYDNDDYDRLTKVANDVNSLLEGNINIKVFGETQAIFTYDLIVDERIKKEAQVYNYYYENGDKNGTGKVSQEELDKAWDSVLGITKKPFSEMTLADVIDIERKRDQNISNSLHKSTKLRILEICSADSPIEERMLRLSQIEHERWVAYSKLNGWQRLSYKEGMALARKINPDAKEPLTRVTKKKLHADICPWDDIRKWSPEDQKETQSYDLRVVNTSLLLKKEVENEKQ